MWITLTCCFARTPVSVVNLIIEKIFSAVLLPNFTARLDIAATGAFQNRNMNFVMPVFPSTMAATLRAAYVTCFILSWTRAYRLLPKNACQNTICIATNPERYVIPSDVMVSFGFLIGFAAIDWWCSLIHVAHWSLSRIVGAFRLHVLKSRFYLICIHLSRSHRFLISKAVF